MVNLPVTSGPKLQPWWATFMCIPEMPGGKIPSIPPIYWESDRAHTLLAALQTYSKFTSRWECLNLLASRMNHSPASPTWIYIGFAQDTWLRSRLSCQIQTSSMSPDTILQSILDPFLRSISCTDVEAWSSSRSFSNCLYSHVLNSFLRQSF